MKKLYKKKWQGIFGKRRLRLLMGLVPICIFIFTCNLWTLPADAATLCVNPGGTNGCYAMPSAAVAAAAANSGTDVILIHPGTYAESGEINVTEAGLRILGDDPSNTIITLQSIAGSVNVFRVSVNPVEISGLTISAPGHKNGIEITSSGYASIHNNNIVNNTGGAGIYTNTTAASFHAFNNIVAKNMTGIQGNCCGANSNKIVESSIVYSNSGAGISYAYAFYNSFYANGTNMYTSSGTNNILLDCRFVSEGSGDYRLQDTSPCKNTGSPSTSEKDVDGTINDMGSFGGPGAALFWPYGNGGPVVTNLTVDPPYVPQGGTLSIKGTVEIR